MGGLWVEVTSGTFEETFGLALFIFRGPFESGQQSSVDEEAFGTESRNKRTR